VKLPDHIHEFFRRQGAIGVRRRNRNLSPERRQEIARKAAQTRWAKRKDKKR
jgi:hypothetical protein